MFSFFFACFPLSCVSCCYLFSFFFASNLLCFGSSQVEDKKVPEKTLQTPLLPSPVAEHVKCNILKAQLENASRVSAQVCGSVRSFEFTGQDPLQAREKKAVS